MGIIWAIKVKNSDLYYSGDFSFMQGQGFFYGSLQEAKVKKNVLTTLFEEHKVTFPRIGEVELEVVKL